MKLRHNPDMRCRADVPFASMMPVHIHMQLPLDFHRLSPAVVQARKETMGAREFARAFQQCAISEEDLLFHGRIEQSLDMEHTIVERVEPGDYWNSHMRVVGVDLAIASESTESAFFVAMVIAVTANDSHRWPLYMYRGRIDFTQQFDIMKDINERFRPHMFYVESNGYQKALVQLCSNKTMMPIQGVFTGKAEKNSVDVGMPSMAVEFEHAKWHIPQGDAKSIRMFGQFIEELGTYPAGDYTDTVMASFFARQGITDGAALTPRVIILS